jgi:hypothetical protein
MQFPQPTASRHDPLERTIFDLQLHGLVDFKADSWMAKKAWQFDADQGSQYRLFYLEAQGHTEPIFLFFQLDGPEFILSEEEIFPMSVTTTEPLESLPKNVEVQGERFTRATSFEAQKFDLSHNAGLYKAHIVFYSSASHARMLRLDCHNGNIQSVYLGEVVKPTAFSHVLPPA